MVRPETFGPYYVYSFGAFPKKICKNAPAIFSMSVCLSARNNVRTAEHIIMIFHVRTCTIFFGGGGTFHFWLKSDNNSRHYMKIYTWTEICAS